ncbi:hypothetical protein GCM10029964_066840 [Kibdelosporangium lantanae]
MDTIPTGSLPPSCRSACGEDTSKHLLLRVTDGYITTNPYRSAIRAYSVPE